MNRAMQFRLPTMKFFVPYSEGFYTRQQQCQNAILGNVIGSTNLGQCPQETMAYVFAPRFRKFSNDFHVACHCDKNYVIFLPQ